MDQYLFALKPQSQTGSAWALHMTYQLYLNKLIKDMQYLQQKVIKMAELPQPKQEREEVDKHKLYVSNLDSSVSNRKTESDLREIFSKYGKITSISVRRNERHKKLYAFINFQDASKAQEAVDNLDDTYFGDEKIKVQYQRTHKPQKQFREQREVRDQQGQDGRVSSRQMNNVTCYRCNKVGHFARECQQKVSYGSRNDRNRPRDYDNRDRRQDRGHRQDRDRREDKKKKSKESSSSNSSSSSSSSKHNDRRRRRNRSRSSSSSSSSNP